MAIYIGRTKCNLFLGKDLCNVNILASTPIRNRVRLLTSDGLALKDSNGLYLTTNEVVSFNGALMLSSDGYILTDADGLYLTIKESE